MTTLLEKLRLGEAPDFEVLDLHGHVGRYAYPIPDLTPEGFQEVLDRAHVRSIVCSHMQCMGRDMGWGNAEVLRFMKACPGRILGYVSLFPISATEVRRQTAHWLAEGFTGLKLHDHNGFLYDDSAYMPAYELANERALPVLFHAWGQDRQFDAILRIAERFPELSILLAHGGSTNPDAYIQTALAAPNVFIDTCVSSCRRDLVEELVAGAGVGKIVFGSDSYFYSLTQQLGKIMGAKLSDVEKEQILHDNAARILARIQS
ncbi:MAG: amidohydrolase family protein [Lentisphaeria bacterium]|nr:amidohydrolase family protein [Lentisphaeria bacterium]